jgi:hypothetical protein
MRHRVHLEGQRQHVVGQACGDQRLRVDGVVVGMGEAAREDGLDRADHLQKAADADVVE